MRQFTLLLAVLVVVGGCKKSQPQIDTPSSEPGPGGEMERASLLGALVDKRGDARRTAIDNVAEKAASDPVLRNGLVELLKHRSTAGLGKTHPREVTSTREAAALALVKAGPAGETALKEQGFTILREGLKDADVAIKEHTAHTIGRLGPLAKPLSADVQKLIGDADANVRGVAADAVRDVGVTDVPNLAKLLVHPTEASIRRYASELLSTVNEVPPDAVQPLIEALADPDPTVRLAAANALALAGPAAGAPAAVELANAIRASYPAMHDPTMQWFEGAELAYWLALTKIGEPAVPALLELFAHTNTLVRYYAAQSLGEIGPPAKASLPVLLKKLGERMEDGLVLIEAACALCRIDEGNKEGVALIGKALDSEGARFALAAIPRMGPAGKTLIPQALKSLDASNPNARYAAVQLVGRLDPADAAKAVSDLAKLAEDREQLIRLRVGEVLEKLGPAASPAAATLARVLPTEMDAAVKEQFVMALMAMGPGAKPAALVLAAQFDSADTATNLRPRVLIAAAIADPNNSAIAAMTVRAASERDSSIREGAATAIGKLDPIPPESLAALMRLLKTDPITPVRVAAVKALAEAGPKAKAIRGEMDAIAAAAMPRVALWAKVAAAAMDGDVKKSAATVRAALADPSPEARGAREAAAEALLLIGPIPADAAALTAMLKDGVGKEAAARALGKLGPAAKEAVSRLADLLEDRDSATRIAAADALGEIGPAALPAVAKLRAATKDPTLEPAARKALEKLGVKDAGGSDNRVATQLDGTRGRDQGV